jgi:hypothetical protein
MGNDETSGQDIDKESRDRVNEPKERMRKKE